MHLKEIEQKKYICLDSFVYIAYNTHVQMEAVHCIKSDGQKNRSRKTLCVLVLLLLFHSCVLFHLFHCFYSPFSSTISEGVYNDLNRSMRTKFVKCPKPFFRRLFCRSHFKRNVWRDKGKIDRKQWRLLQ